MSDLHGILAALAQTRPVLDLGTRDLMVLVAMRHRAKHQADPQLDEDRLVDLYVHIGELAEAGERVHRGAATVALERLRSQRVLARVDGAGLVRAGDYALTALGTAIADTFVSEDQLTRRSLKLLTAQLASNLSALREQAERARTDEDWQDVRDGLSVTVGTLIEGIDRRRLGLDAQQASMRDQIAGLLEQGWAEGIASCEVLLDEATTTLEELHNVLMGETARLQTLLSEVETPAQEAGRDDVVNASRHAADQVDALSAWGRDRHQAWTEYYALVQRFIRDVVRLDPTRAISQRLRDGITHWGERPWHLPLTNPAPYLHLRVPQTDVPTEAVQRQARTRDTQPEVVAPRLDSDLESRVVALLQAHGTITLSEALNHLLPEVQRDLRFRSAGRIARMLARHGWVDSERERAWVPVGTSLEVEQWTVRRRGPR